MRSKNKVILIAKKEWGRFFGDKRMVFGALILPGVLLYLVYAFLAPVMMDLIIGNGTDNTVYVVNTPPGIIGVFRLYSVPMAQAAEYEVDDIIQGIRGKDGNFLIVFPDGFTEKTDAYDVRSGEEAPEVLFYYNSLSAGFMELYGKVNSCLNTFERGISKKFDVNESGGGDLADPGESGASFLAKLLPMFLIVFIFHGALAATTETITGEKENGTLGTILITPVKTLELAAGKIISLGIEAFLCGVSGTLGIILSMPRFMESLESRLVAGEDIAASLVLGTMELGQYSVPDFTALVLVLLTTSCFIVSVIAIVSICAKTAKEAQMMLTPMLLIFMLVSLLSAFNDGGSQTQTLLFLVPIHNCVQSMNDIFARGYTALQIALTMGVNLVLAALGTLALSRLYKNEKITSVN